MNSRLLKLTLGLTGMIFIFTGSVLAQDVPKGYTVPDSTLSPDHHYGVTVPQQANSDSIAHPQNAVVDAKTGHVLAVIKADAGWDRANYDQVLPAQWSADGSLLLWQVDGKWSPTALVLLKIEHGAVTWQMNLLKWAQQAALTRAHQANPQKYAAMKKENAGNGSAFPDGFTVDVYTDLKKSDVLSLPLTLHANLTSNPKEIEGKDELDARVDAILDTDGKFVVKKFALITPDDWAKGEESRPKDD